jgi:hypothetical protein
VRALIARRVRAFLLLLFLTCLESPQSEADSRVKGYAPPLESIREPSQALQLFMPSNQYPSALVDCSHERWEDGMITYKYFDRLQKEGSGWTVRHAFTSNRAELQVEAGELLVAIQEDVELRRPSGRNPGTFFLLVSHSAFAYGLIWKGHIIRMKWLVRVTGEMYLNH